MLYSRNSPPSNWPGRLSRCRCPWSILEPTCPGHGRWISRKAVIDATNQQGFTLSHIAALAGDREALAQILSDEPDICKKGPLGWTPLHWAAASGSLDTVQQILWRAKSCTTLWEKVISAEDDYGRTALHVAAGYGNTAVIPRLLYPRRESHQSYPSGPCYEIFSGTNSPLHLAAAAGHVAAVKVLWNEAARFRGPQSLVRYFTRSSPLGSAVQHGRTPVVQWLLQAAKWDLHMPLYIAVSKGHAEITQILLAARVHYSDGCQVLHLAVMRGQQQLVEVLIKAGVDVDAPWPARGTTPLCLAAQTGDLGMAQQLLAAGANVNASSTDTSRPLHHAACTSGNLAMVQLLLTAGANVNATRDDGCSALHLAANTPGNVPVIRELLEAGADVYATFRAPDGPSGATVLHVAVIKLPEAVHQLIAAGAVVDATDTHGDTPLHNAARCGVETVAAQLIAAGADADRRNVQGCKSLGIAARHGNIAIMQLLLQAAPHAAAHSAEDQKAHPLRMAVYHQQAAAVQLLLQHPAVGISGLDITALVDEASERASASKDYSVLIMLARGLYHRGVMVGCSAVAAMARLDYQGVMAAILEEFVANTAEAAGVQQQLLKQRRGLQVLTLGFGAEQARQNSLSVAAAAGCDLAQDRQGKPLVIAAAAGDLALVRQLLASGVRVNEATAVGSTALCKAVLSGHTGIVKELLAAGAVMPVQGPNTLCPAGPAKLPAAAMLSAAVGNGHFEILDMLLAGFNMQLGEWRDDVLVEAAGRGHHEVILALQKWQVIRAFSPDGVTAAAESAVQSGHYGIYATLIKYLCSIDSRAAVSALQSLMQRSSNNQQQLSAQAVLLAWIEGTSAEALEKQAAGVMQQQLGLQQVMVQVAQLHQCITSGQKQAMEQTDKRRRPV